MKVVNRFKLKNYYHVPWGEPFFMDDETIKKGEKAILKKLIYKGALSIFKNYNKIDEETIENICAHYDLHYYQDKDTSKHLDAHIRYISGIELLVRLDEDEYYDQIEMALRDFHVKNALRTTMDTVIKEFQALLTTERLDDDFERFSDTYFSRENLHLVVRHERYDITDFTKANECLLGLIDSIRKYPVRSTSAYFLGHRCRPHGVVIYDQSRNEEHYGLGITDQDAGQRGLYVVGRGMADHFFLFNLDDNNKVNEITIIRGSMLNLYNIVSGDSEDDI